MQRSEKIYSLKLYDTTLVRFSAYTDRYGIANYHIKDVDTRKRQLFPFPLIDEITPETLGKWIENRIIPKNRKNIEAILLSAGITMGDTLGVVAVSKALSVNDSYWVVEEDQRLSFDKCNLFDNPTEEWLAIIAYTGDIRPSQIDDLRLSTEWTTQGTFPKAWRYINDRLVLYKAGSEGYANAGMEPYSEYFSSQLAQALGLDHVTYDLDRWENRLASTCALMNSKDISFVSFMAATKQFDFPQNAAVCNAFSKKACDNLRDLMVFDALVANRDRHSGNYGFLRDNTSGKIRGLAPIFDNNVALFAHDMESDFPTWTEKITVQNSWMTNLSFDDQVRLVLREEMLEAIKSIKGFEFTNHPHFPAPSNRLAALNIYIQARLKTLSSLPFVDDVSFDIEMTAVLESLIQSGKSIPVLKTE